MIKYPNMRIKDLKSILNRLPDSMPVVVPVIDEDNVNQIFGFRYVRTAGVLTSEGEKDREVLCLNAAVDEYDIADQVRFSGKDIDGVVVLFGVSNKKKQKTSGLDRGKEYKYD